MNVFQVPLATCPLCGALYAGLTNDNPLCSSCAGELLSLPGPFLVRINPGQFPCYAAVEYSGLAKRAIEAVKIGGNRRVADWLATALLGPLIAQFSGSLTGPIVPVPASIRGRHNRGFDQVHRMAEKLTDDIIQPLQRRRGRQQKFLSRSERYANAETRYVLRGKRPFGSQKPSECILIDDVVTTGASIERCGTLLTNEGIHVGAAFVCMTKR